VIREWRLDPYDGDQAPLHLHRGGEEGFICLEGDLEVQVEGERRRVTPGGYVVVPRGAIHTFSSRGGAHVLAIMSPKIAELVDGLHASLSQEELAALWDRCDSALA